MNRDQALELLRASVGDQDADFREGQWEAIDAVANRQRKLLVVERTGWGKSSVYFIATRILRERGAGPTLIVSPLLALMRNQVSSAESLGIRATRIDSTNADQWGELSGQILRGEYDVLLVSPERLSNERFVEEVLLPLANSIGLLVVDEAHCISDWGHDFRPDYRRIVNVLQQMPPNMPVLGTTATANDRVVNDVVGQLGDIDVIRGSLARDSLALQTIEVDDQASRLAWLASNVPQLEGTGIIYVLTKRDAERVAEWLRSNDVDAYAYYSGAQADGYESTAEYRQHLEQQLLDNRIDVLVATVALGMGFDKPDLAFVIHFQAPGSIVAYYQQVGRAGRGIANATVVLLSGAEDERIHEYFRRTAFPSEDQVREILSALEESDGLNVRELESRINLRYGQITAVLKYLSVETPAPIVKQGANWERTPVHYQLDHQKIERLTGQRESEWQEIQDFVHTDRCLMEFLRVALDDPEAAPCGRCANCLGRPILPVDVDRDLVARASRFLRKAEVPLETNKQVAAGAFPEYGFRGNLPLDIRAEEGRVLSRWGDAGWGQVVADGKRESHFADTLVLASVEMIQERWRPDPYPEWVTCVPSEKHPELVPKFAERLANALELPFMPIVRKVKHNEPQKQQQNRFRQCQNLDGAFEIDNEVAGSTVLLVDDVADSRWTMTVVAALLREAGSGPVLPFALADTSTSG